MMLKVALLFAAAAAAVANAAEPPPQGVEGDPFWPAVAPTNAAVAALTVQQGNNMPLVKASLVGHECVLLFDTGATHTTFDAAFVERALLGVSLTPVMLAGETNVARAPAVFRAASLKMGDAEFKDFLAMSLDLSHLTAAIGTKVDGVIGMNVISRVRTLLSLGDSRVTFQPAIEALEGFGLRVRRDMADPMGIAIVSSHNDSPLRLIVDSGASFTFLNRGTRWPVTGVSVTMDAVSVNGDESLAPQQGAEGVLTFGGAGVKIRPLVVAEPLNCIGADALLGCDMLIDGDFVAFRPR